MPVLSSRGGGSIRGFNPGLTDPGVFDYLVVAGGAGGGASLGCGGSARGYLQAADDGPVRCALPRSRRPPAQQHSSSPEHILDCESAQLQPQVEVVTLGVSG